MRNTLTNIFKQIKNGRLTFFFMLVAVFFLPIWRNFFVIVLWPWTLLFIVESILNREQFRHSIKPGLPILFLPLLFFMLLLSLIWSEDITTGLQHIGRSLLLLIIPALLGLSSTLQSNRNRNRIVLKVFVLGTTSALLIIWINAIVYSISIDKEIISFSPQVGDWENAFYHMAFSFLIHPTYFGMMILLAAAVCLQEILTNDLRTKRSIWLLALSVFLIGSLFFVSSRAMIGAAIILIIYSLFYRIHNRKVLIVSLIASVIILLSMAGLHPRFSDLREKISSGEEKLPLNAFYENSDRVKTWTASFHLVRENPFLGVGLGDVEDALKGKYQEMGLFSDADHYLNCHNQFIEIWLATGMAGIILLLLIIVYPFRRKVLSNKYLYISFLIITVTAFLFESVLNRLWGIAFFAFFYIMLTAVPGIKTELRKI